MRSSDYRQTTYTHHSILETLALMGVSKYQGHPVCLQGHPRKDLQFVETAISSFKKTARLPRPHLESLLGSLPPAKRGQRQRGNWDEPRVLSGKYGACSMHARGSTALAISVELSLKYMTLWLYHEHGPMMLVILYSHPYSVPYNRARSFRICHSW